MRKVLFFLFILALTGFAVTDCSPADGEYGFVDYLNILFCNTRLYPLYDRSIWQIINLLFFIVIINTGIYFLSESHYNFSRGFRSMVLIRYGNTRCYLLHIVRFSIMETAKFIGYLIVNCVLVLAATDKNALSFFSHLVPKSAGAIIAYLLLYAIKIIFFYTLIQVSVSYFLIRFRYEPILVTEIVATAVLLYADIQLGTNFITLSLDTRDIFYAGSYAFLLLFSGVLINKRLKKKEM